jgi:hypothetical protein
MTLTTVAALVLYVLFPGLALVMGRQRQLELVVGPRPGTDYVEDIGVDE